ncbi:MAG: dihydrolipoamide acetyltransferase family protein, partial [Planctomycetota bacterium]
DSIKQAKPADVTSESSVADAASKIQDLQHVDLKHTEKPPQKIIATPRAKRLAKEMALDLASVQGTGPKGKITEDDVKKMATTQSAESPAGRDEIKLGARLKISKLQQITAQRMLKSKQEIPCFYLSLKADITALTAERTRMNEESGTKVSYHDFLIKAFAKGLEKFPLMAGQLDGDEIKLTENINIGLAMEAPNGLIVPVIKDANKKDLRRIASETKELIEKARNEKLALTDLEGACITISNLGSFGIESFIPIVIPSQCSIVGVGQIIDSCVPNNTDVAVRKLMTINLSVDHKVVNGVYASQFLDFVKKLLKDPSSFV